MYDAPVDVFSAAFEVLPLWSVPYWSFRPSAAVA